MLHIHLLYANKNVLPTYLLGISTIAFTVPSASDTAVFTRRVGRMSSPMMSANVKSALLRGWRERWPDERWSVAVKRHFPQGSTGDACQLAG